MRVRVTLANIVEYGLDTLTGNSRIELLARAQEMEANGYDMFVTLPDVEGGDTEAPTERNVFEHFNTELPIPDGSAHSQEALNLVEHATTQCTYKLITMEDQVSKWICITHYSPSKHKIEDGSHEPCLVMDPYGHDWEL